MLGARGVIAIDESVAAVTCRVALAEMELQSAAVAQVAVMVVSPGLTPVAVPLPSMVATLGVDEDHVTFEVRS